MIIQDADFIIEFNTRWWAAVSLSVAVLAPVAYFCYRSLGGQRRLLRISLTLIRAVSTLGLLLLALDATLIRTYSAGSRLLVIQAGADLSAAAWALPGDERLNGRFRIISSAGSIPELEKFLRASLQENDQIAGAVIRARSPVEAAAAAGIVRRQIAAPLFVMLDNPSSSDPDVSVISAGTDGRAILGIPKTIHITIHGRGVAGRTTRIELRDEVRALGSADVIWKGENESAIVPLTFTPAVEGANRYSISAAPHEDEAARENNEASFTLDIRRAERRVLFIENQPTWEGKFIRRVLGDNIPIKLDYFAQISREAVLAQPSEEGSGRDLHKILSNFNMLARYDLIIAGPMDAAYFSPREAENVNDFIERRGGGLIILGSNDHSGSILSRSSGLAHLSPANLSSWDLSNSRGEGATFLAPTDEGIAEGLFHSRRDGDDFEKLGPISTSYLKVGSLKPGAQPFARDSSIAGPQSPVLVAGQTYGLGRTLLVSPSDSWRSMLATPSDEKNHFTAFWQNLTFWASAGAEPRSYISIASPSIQRGEGLTAYLTARDEAFKPLASFTIEAEIEVTSADGEGAVEKLPLIVEQVADAPGVYRLSSGVFSEGRGVLRVRVQTPGREEDDLSLAFYQGSEDRRLRETPDLLDRLEQAAVESGGRVFGIQETDRLITRLMGLETGSVPVQYTFKMRDSVALAFILPLLFATEYLLRRVTTERPRSG